MKRQVFLPLVTYPVASEEASIANGVAVARLLDAGLSVLALEVDIPPISNVLAGALINLPEMIRDAERHSALNAAKFLEQATEKAAAAGVALATERQRRPLTLLDDAAVERARYFDLSVMGWNGGNPGARQMAESVLFGSGRPLLLVPDAIKVERFDKIVIAWDGSRVSARAVADARPLLAKAGNVSVVTVVDEKPLKARDAGERLVASLGLAGIDASFTQVRTEGKPIAETLQGHAAASGADLMVVGGYGHSRLRDFVLGGATAGLFQDLKLPVLLAH